MQANLLQSVQAVFPVTLLVSVCWTMTFCSFGSTELMARSLPPSSMGWAEHQALVLPPERAAAAPSAEDLKAQHCVLMCIFFHRAASLSWELKWQPLSAEQVLANISLEQFALGTSSIWAWLKTPLGKEGGVIPVGHHRSSLTGAKAAACRAQVMHGGFLQKKGLSCRT